MIFGATYNTSSGTILISHKTPGLSLNVSHNNEDESFIIENKVRKLDTRGLYEITGTPDSSVMPGNYPIFITSVGTACNPITLPAGNIRIETSSSISRTSIAATDNQVVCDGDPIQTIEYTVTGTSSTSYYITPNSLIARLGLGDSITGNTISISGTLNVSNWAETTYNYTVFTTGNENGCNEDSVSGSITVNPLDYLIVSSPATHTLQDVCVGDAISDIDFEYWGPDSLTVSVTNLPPGISPVFTTQPFITSIDFGAIAATTIVSETHYVYVNGREYMYESTGGETPADIASKLQAVVASDTLRIVNASLNGSELILTGITPGESYSVDTDRSNFANLASLPPVVVQGPRVVTLTGSPTTAGNYNVSVSTVSGTCGTPVIQTATINVNPDATLTLISSATTADQDVCEGDAITAIEYRFDNATGANITPGTLPSGVFRDITAPANVVRIVGTPSFLPNLTVPRVFRYEISTNGASCVDSTVYGFITVQPQENVNYIGSTDALCQESAIIPANKYSFEVFGTNDAFIISPTINIPNGMTSTSSYTSQEVTLSVVGSSAQAGEEYVIRINGSEYPYTTAGVENAQTIAAGLEAAISNPAISVARNLGELTFTGTTGILFSAVGYTDNGNATINHVLASDVPVRGIISITGTPTTQATPTTYNITVQTRGSNCSSSSATFALDINSISTVNVISGSATTTGCDQADITDIVLQLGGGAVSYSDVGAGLGWSPSNPFTPASGVIWNSALRQITIDGTPNTGVTTSTDYSYTFITQGNSCAPEATFTVTLTIDPVDIINVTTGSENQAFCETASPTLFSPVEFTIGGGASSASITWTTVNPGLSLVRSLTSPNIYNLIGTPSVDVVGSVATRYEYTVTTSGTCTSAQIVGAIDIQPQSEMVISPLIPAFADNQTASNAVCNNDTITPIVYDVGGGALLAGEARATVTWSPSNPFGVDLSRSSGSTYIIEGQLSTTDIVPTIYTYTIETQNVFGCVAEVSYTGRIELLPSPSFLPLAPPGSPENYEIHNYIEDNTCNVTSSAFVADGSLSIPISPTTTFNQIVTGGINNTAQIDILRINYQPAHPTSALSLNDFIRIRIESSNGVTSNDYFEDKGNDLPLNPGVLQTDIQFLQDFAAKINATDPIVNAFAGTDGTGDFLQFSAKVPGDGFNVTLLSRSITPGNANSSVDITNSVSNTRWYYEIDLYDSSSNLVPKDSSDPDRLTWSQLVGDYLLEVAITNGVKRCSSTVTLTVEEPPVLSMNVSQCTDNVQVTATGGTPPYTFRLFDLDDNAYVPVPGIAAGLFSSTDPILDISHNFEIEVRDDNGCFVREALDIYGPSISINRAFIETTIIHDLCFESPSNLGGGSIQPSLNLATAFSGGSGQYAFQWTTTSGSSTLQYFTSDIQGLLPGNYFLTVTDLVLGCSESDPLPYTILSVPPFAVSESLGLSSSANIVPWVRQQTGVVTPSTSTNTLIEDMIVLCPSETQSFLEVTITNSAPVPSGIAVGHSTTWYRNGTVVSTGDRIDGTFGPGIYEARVSRVSDGALQSGCTESYFIELRESESLSIRELLNLRVEDYCINDSNGSEATLTYYISGGIPNDTYNVSFNGGAITGSSGTDPREIVINVDPTAISQITSAEIIPQGGCSPITQAVSSTLNVPDDVTITLASSQEIDCANNQLGRISLSISGDAIDLDNVQIQWQGTLDDPNLPGYNAYLPWNMTGIVDSSGASVPNATLYDIRYAGTYTANVIYQTASSTCQLTSTPIEVTITDVAEEQLVVSIANVIQPGCGETVGSIELSITNANPPISITWEKYVELELFTATTTTTTSSTTTSTTSTSTTSAQTVQQWQELTEFRGQATAINLENGIYRATIQDPRGAGSGVCPSGAVRTRPITIGSQGIEIQNATVREVIPDDCDSDEEVTASLNFRVESNIPTSGTNTFDIEITGNSRGLVYSTKTASTTVADNITFVRRGQNYTFSGLLYDTYSVVASLPTGTGSDTVECDDVYIFTVEEYLPLEYTGATEFLIDECTGIAEITADVSGGKPFVVDGQAIYQFNWVLRVKDGDVFTGETINYVGQTIEVGIPGELSLTIYDSNNCYITVDSSSALGAIEVSFESEPFRIVPNLTDDDGNDVFALAPSCGTDSGNGSIGFNVEGGSPPYSILWYVEDPVSGRTSNPHIGYRKLDIENRSFSNELQPGNYKIVIESQNTTCGGSTLNRFEQNIVVPINKDLYIIDGPFVDEDLCRQLPGRIVVDIFDNLQGNLSFYYNNIPVNTDINRLSDRSYTLLIPDPQPEAELRIVNEEGCSITSNIVLGVGEPEFEYTSINLEASGNILAREEVTFENTSTDPFVVSEWIFGDNTPSEFVYVRSDSVSPTRHEYGISGTYFATLRIYNDIGCSEEVTKPIVVGNGYNILVPNVFTPNGDNSPVSNERFKPIFSGFGLLEFTVYDNRGNKIYYEITPQDGQPIQPEGYSEQLQIQGWDGNNAGYAPYYIYTIRGITLFGEKEIERSGTFILLR